jgi:hypothetical protein
MFSKLPDELSTTFQKMISQLDIIANTMKIMDQRIATVENQVTDLYHNHKVRKSSQSQNESFNKKPIAGMSGTNIPSSYIVNKYFNS